MTGGEQDGRLAFHGRAALRRLGTRVAWMYLAAGALAVLVEAVGGPAPTGRQWLGLLGLLAVLAGTRWLVQVACRRPGLRPPVVAAVLAGAASGVGVVVWVDAGPGW